MKKLLIITSILLCFGQTMYGIFGRKTVPYTPSKELIETVREKFNAKNKTVKLEEITSKVETMPEVKSNQKLLEITIDGKKQVTTIGGHERFVIVDRNNQFVSLARHYDPYDWGDITINPDTDLGDIMINTPSSTIERETERQRLYSPGMN